MNRVSHGIQDDYVKFLRFAQWRIERTGVGIVAFVTNHSFLTSPTLRGMRRKPNDIFLRNLSIEFAWQRTYS